MTVQQVPVNHFRCAIATQEYVTNINVNKLPTFRPKWSQNPRPYVIQDLLLPDFCYIKGSDLTTKEFTIAIGGTRSPCVETFCLVSNLVRELAKYNLTILSGGVPGVDLAAHMAALECQNASSTIAVLANPVEVGLSGHEWNNIWVEKRILTQGGFISEYDTFEPFGSAQYRDRLLSRDRIISGLADLFIAFECGIDSATVDTARRASLQGKKILCIESSITTNRYGVRQLANELGFQCISEVDMTIESMAKFIIAILAQ